MENDEGEATTKDKAYLPTAEDVCWENGVHVAVHNNGWEPESKTWKELKAFFGIFFIILKTFI